MRQAEAHERFHASRRFVTGPGNGQFKVSGELLRLVAREAEPPEQFEAMHLAALSNSADVVTTLVDSGANIEAKTRSGHTPLHYAASQNTAEVVTILLDAGANIQARDLKGRTPYVLVEKNKKGLKGTEAHRRLR